MGDRIAVMRDGKIIQLGSFDELYYSPANLFVAQFIGSPPIGVLPASVTDHEVVIGNERWSLPESVASSVPPGPVRVGVRPEGWNLNAADGAQVPIRHIERIPTERSSFLFGSLADVRVVIATGLDVPETAEVRATPDWDRAYFFASDSEETLRSPGVLELF
jgi:ABC-type sugar transport system ATPase subunit